jgi:hypothetical protein
MPTILAGACIGEHLARRRQSQPQHSVHPVDVGLERILAEAPETAINRFLDEHNEKPKPFVWRTDPLSVLAAIERGKQALESIH